MTDPGLNDAISDEDFGLALSKLSAEAFTMAVHAAEDGDFAAHEARARELDQELTSSWERIEKTPEPAQSALSKDWTDARLDLSYILSKGELATSTRLHFALQDRG